MQFQIVKVRKTLVDGWDRTDAAVLRYVEAATAQEALEIFFAARPRREGEEIRCTAPGECCFTGNEIAGNEIIEAARRAGRQQGSYYRQCALRKVAYLEKCKANALASLSDKPQFSRAVERFAENLEARIEKELGE